MTKKLVVTLIVILIMLNIGAGYFLFYSAKTKADDLTNSAKSASESVTNQNAIKFGLNTSSLPKKDVAGEDPAGIARYIKAVRSAYTKTTDNTVTVEYKVLAPVNVVLSFYRTELAQSGWILITSSSEAITFQKDKQIITITGTNSGGVTTYTIVLK